MVPRNPLSTFHCRLHDQAIPAWNVDTLGSTHPHLLKSSPRRNTTASLQKLGEQLKDAFKIPGLTESRLL